MLRRFESLSGGFWTFNPDSTEVFVIHLDWSRGLWLYVRFPNALPLFSQLWRSYSHKKESKPSSKSWSEIKHLFLVFQKHFTCVVKVCFDSTLDVSCVSVSNQGSYSCLNMLCFQGLKSTWILYFCTNTGWLCCWSWVMSVEFSISDVTLMTKHKPSHVFFIQKLKKYKQLWNQLMIFNHFGQKENLSNHWFIDDICLFPLTETKGSMGSCYVVFLLWAQPL